VPVDSIGYNISGATLAVIPFVRIVRLWSLHPSVLDRAGLLALWREGLLAQKVLLGQTSGYRFHPQLERFRASGNPVAAISTYLWAVADEASVRGYNFTVSKIAGKRHAVSLTVTQGQLEYEREHLRKKLRVRDQAAFLRLSTAKLIPHPMLRVVSGGMEPWEVVRHAQAPAEPGSGVTLKP
jgi:hypothetical protein